MKNEPDLSNMRRLIIRLRTILREAENATLPCGLKPADYELAIGKLMTAAKELEGALQ